MSWILPTQIAATQGWQCPCCHRVYSPTTAMCFACPAQTFTSGDAVGTAPAVVPGVVRLTGQPKP